MRNPNQRPAGATSQEAEARPKMRNQDHGKVEDGEPNTTWKKKGATRQRPAGATSTGVGEPLPGAEKKEATTRQRPAGARRRRPRAEDDKSRPRRRRAGGNIPRQDRGLSATSRPEDETPRPWGRRGLPPRRPSKAEMTK